MFAGTSITDFTVIDYVFVTVAGAVSGVPEHQVLVASERPEAAVASHRSLTGITQNAPDTVAHDGTGAAGKPGIVGGEQTTAVSAVRL